MRLNKKNKKKVVIAVVLGILATFFLFNSMNKKETALMELNKKIQEQNAAIANLKQNPFDEGKVNKGEKTSAVVAAGNINVGDTLTEELLEIKEFEDDVVPEGYFKTTAMVVGKKSGKTLVKGQFITTSEIQAEDLASIEIPNNMRAISVPTERLRGLASHIRVGASVDLLKLGNPPEFVAQNIRIVAFEAKNIVDNSRYNSDAGSAVNPQFISANQASAITFLIPVDLVSKVVDNIFVSQLQIITRNSNDDKVLIVEKELPPIPEDLPGINIPDDPLEDELEPVELPQAEPHKIEIIKAMNIEVEEFSPENNKTKGSKDSNMASSSDLSELKELLDMVQ